jgi:regulatory protein
MSTIVSIEPLPRRKGGYTLTLDDGRTISIHEEVIVKYKLKSGMELDDDQLEKWILEADAKMAYDMALRYLAFRSRSRKQLCDYLTRKGFNSQAIEAAAGKLEEYGFLNDQDFAIRYVKDKNLGKPAGRRLIAHELQSKGISQDVLDNALSHFSEKEELEQAIRLAMKYQKRFEGVPSKESRVKIARALQRRGFGWEAVKNALQQLQCDDEESFPDFD